MPKPELSHRKQKAVLWAYSGRDRHGQLKVSGTGVELNVRIEKSRREVLAPDANAIAADLTLVVDREIAEGSILWIGELDDVPDDLNNLTDLFQVITYSEIPNIKGRVFYRTVTAMKYSDQMPTTV